jgi:hypothetical protein
VFQSLHPVIPSALPVKSGNTVQQLMDAAGSLTGEHLARGRSLAAV